MTKKQRKKFRQDTNTMGQRFDVMPSRVHGNESRKTQRRKAKQNARANGWD
jgi:hypothetical protein